MENTVVAHFVDGKILKGHSDDFFPNKPTFHIAEVESGNVTEVEISQLKALFFVKTFEGNKDHEENKEAERAGLGRRIKVRFKDGEILVGYTSGYSPDRAAFFLFPADPQSNNERIFVVTAATEEVAFV
ncbi:MAG: hypothetical protein V3T81_09760 [Thermoanaerobaculia bacterium]